MKSFNLQALKKLSLRIFGVALIIFLGLNMSFAQTDVKIGNNVGNKNASAVLELESTTKGFLMPRMSPAQVAAISNPAVGLQIYNTTDSCIYVYRGITGWYSTCGGFNAWSTFGNTGINPLTNFLGTTDGQPLVIKTNGVERLRFDAAGNINQNGAGAVNLTGFVTANAGATITGPSAGAGTVNINTVGANTTNIGTAVSTTNLNGANLFVPSLPVGSTTTDALIAVNRATGKADTLNIANLVSTGITANNGLTKTGANVALGGSLISPTIVSTDAVNTIALFGLTHGNAATDSILVATTGSSVLKKVSISDVGASSVTASNGLNKTAANDVQLGGTLTKNTLVDQGTFSLTINGTGTGATNIGNSGSSVTIAGTTGVTGTTSINTSGAAATTIGNSGSATTIVGATTINNSGTAVTTIGNASSAVTIAGTTGVTGVTSINTGASATATNIGNAASTTTILGATNVNTGTSATATNIGNANSATTIVGATTINNSGTAVTTIGNASSAVTIAGTTGVTGTTTINTTGTSNTSIGNATGTITALGATSINTSGTASTSIGNSGSNVIIAGATSVTGITTINTTGTSSTTIGNATGTNTVTGNNLVVTNLPTGATTDSLVSVNYATGAVRKLNISNVVGSAITANNGLTKTVIGGVANIALGGTLTGATTIDQSANSLTFSNGTHNINATGTGATNIGNTSSATTVLGATNVNTTGNATTSIGNSGSAVTIAGTTSVTGITTINTTGASNTSIGNATGTITALGATNVNTTGAAATTIGNTTSTTTINGTSLIVPSLPAGGLTTDALVSVNRATGKADTLNIASIVSNNFTANNGLTKTIVNTVANVALGGTLTANTTIDQSTFSLGINNGTSSGATNIGNAASTTTILGATNVNTGTSATATNIGNTNSATTIVGTTTINNSGSAATTIGNANSNVAIGQTTTPNSSLQVTGSMGVSYQKVTSSYTLLNSDYIVLANATSGALTITLPTATATLKGRIYTIGKTDETTNIVTFSPALQLTESTTVSSINFATKYRVVCDGSLWWIYNE